jgi:hypothetical protein
MLHVDYFYKLCLGNALEWFHSLLPGTITSWDVLENLFAEEFSHPPSPIWTQDKEYFISSHNPYEYILSSKLENETKEPSPNVQEDFILATDDEKSQEHWQKKNSVEENNLENIDGQDFHSMKEEFFQNISVNQNFWMWSVIRRKMKSMLKLEIPYPIKDGQHS